MARPPRKYKLNSGCPGTSRYRPGAPGSRIHRYLCGRPGSRGASACSARGPRARPGHSRRAPRFRPLLGGGRLNRRPRPYGFLIKR